MTAERKCSFEGCGKGGRITRGLCATHYMRLLRRGSPHVALKPGRQDGTYPNKHVLYRAWAGMVSRCHNHNNTAYARYGGRGIKVCAEWRASFWNFLRDMGERPEGMSLDRIDANGPYAPSNCRWATIYEQRANWTDEGKRRHSQATKAYHASRRSNSLKDVNVVSIKRRKA